MASGWLLAGPERGGVRVLQNSTTFLLVFLTLAAAAVAQTASHAVVTQSPAVQPDVNTIVGRMEQAQEENRTHTRAYTVTRDYKLFHESPQRPDSEVVAQLSFLPPDNKNFNITQSSGSSRGEKIVRHLLETEKEQATKHNHTAITRENYQFRYLGMETLSGSPAYVLQLVPKRHEKDLVEGRAWVDAHTYLIRRIQGDLSKNPSWWLKTVHVDIEYGPVEGMWLQTASQAVADVRFFGEHTLDSRAVRFQTAEAVASKKPISQNRPGSAVPARPFRNGAAGAAVFVHQ